MGDSLRRTISDSPGLTAVNLDQPLLPTRPHLLLLSLYYNRTGFLSQSSRERR